MKRTILILGNQRSWSSITMRLLEAYGIHVNIPSFLDPAGQLNGAHELRSLGAVTGWVYRLVFGSREDSIPYREISQVVSKRTEKGYATLSEGERYPHELLEFGCDIINSCAALTSDGGTVVAMKVPIMVLCWDFWKQAIALQQSRGTSPTFILGMTVRNPHEIAMSYMVRGPSRFHHVSDVYGLIDGWFRSQLAVMEEYRHQKGFTILPIRACQEHYRADVKRLLSTAGVAWSEDIFAEHFQVKATHDTGVQKRALVFETYKRLLEVCETLSGAVYE